MLEQREQLRGRARQTEAMIHAIDVALAALDGNGGTRIARVEDLFKGFNPSQYDEEVRQRWGQSEASVESKKRTAHYTPDDWKALRGEQTAIYDEADSAMRAGRPRLKLL